MTQQTQFKVGHIYYGSLSCAHSCFAVRCVKRTAKCVFFKHATHPEMYAPKRSTVRKGREDESANFHGWYISSDKRDLSIDILTH